MNKKFLLTMLFISLSPLAHSDLLSVQDFQMIELARQQLHELSEQYAKLEEATELSQSQLNSLKELKSMNSGHYGFGNLSNGLDSLQSWQSPTSTWEDALHNLSGGNPERYKSLMDAYERNHPALNESSYGSYVNRDKLARFKEDKAVNRAVQVQTTKSYNEINEHMAALHKLSKEIEKTPNTKGAVDLNSRLITELAFIQLMSLRLQALMSQQVAQESLSELQDRAELAKFNHLPK